MDPKSVDCGQGRNVSRQLICIEVKIQFLEELVLQSHFRLWLETNTGAEDVGQSVALLAQSVHNRGTRRGQGSLGSHINLRFK